MGKRWQMGPGWAQVAMALAYSLVVSAVLSLTNSPTYHSVLTDVRDLFNELVLGLPEGCARVEQRVGSDSAVVDILPSNANAAPLRAIVPKSVQRGITVVAGQG